MPGAGWIGLDPTSGLFAGEGHIPLACTPHPTSAAPITGTTGPPRSTFDFTNVVHRVREDPRVTLPYTPEQWARIDELGAEVDERLDAGDVRLTMGGEPTFVSIDDMEGAEWNTAADGAAKRALADELAAAAARPLRPRRADPARSGQVVSGRAAAALADRHRAGARRRPLWARADLLADLRRARQPSTSADAARFAEGVAARFGLDAERVVAAYEDPVDQAWREARLPAGDPPATDVDPRRGRSASTTRRPGPSWSNGSAGAAAEPAGFVLPLHPAPDGDGWRHARTMAPAARSALPDPRRLAARPAAAARLADVVAAAADLRTVAVRARDALPDAGIAARRARPTMVDRARGCADRARGRGPRWARLPCSSRRSRTPSTPSSCWRSSRRSPPSSTCPVVIEGYPLPARPPARHPRRHPRPRRHRGQRAADPVVGRAAARRRGALRRGPADPARHREVLARRHPHRYRRRQPRHPRRRDAGRQPAAAPSRPAAQHDHLLAAPPVAVLPVLRASSSARRARRRGSTKVAPTRSTSSRSPSPSSNAAATTCRRGWSTGCSATCSST